MLSNKLTFSLSFIVMLVFGLALLATPAFAGKYSARWDTVNSSDPPEDTATDVWDITIDFPTTAEHDGTALQLLNDDLPNIATASGDEADDDVTWGNASDQFAAVSYLESDGKTTTTVPSQIAFVRYMFQNVDPTQDDDTATPQDEGAMSFAIAGYNMVTLSTADRATGHPLTFLFAEDDPTASVFTVDIDKSLQGGFFILYDQAVDDNLATTAERLSNGIRLGTGYVDQGATAPVDLPDLAAFFQQGGSIVLTDGGSGVAAGEAYITEVMWGYDAMDGTGIPSSDNQWIEVYYQGEAETATVRLRFVYNQVDLSGIDEISNVYLAQWAPKGQSGRSGYSAIDGSAPVPIQSMYRKRGLVPGPTPMYDSEAKFEARGELAGSWEASKASINLSGAFVGSPGSAHLPPRVGTHDVVQPAITESPIRINEVRNDTSANDVDWIELVNVGTEAMNLKDIELSVVTGVSRNDRHGERGYHKNNPAYEKYEHDKAIVGHDDFNNDGQNDVKRFPDWMLPAGAHIVITNQDPDDTSLAGGKDIEVLANPNIDDKTTNRGSSAYYFITSHLNGRLDTRAVDGMDHEPLLVLRTAVDKNETHEAIIDLAGGGRYEDKEDVAKYNFNTEVWPLKGTKSEGGPAFSGGGAWDLTEGDPHEWWKSKAVSSNGVGYDKMADIRFNPGTPGYANDAVKDRLIDKKGTSSTADDVVLINGNVSISEIMFDASVHAGNERWNLVQWIELYNSSMTEAVNLKGWELEIRNSDDHVDSFVDSSFTFNDAIIQPNQTILIVSARASNNGISDAQIYNLFTQHARVLGLANRRANLLSPAGFFLRLIDNNDDVVDEAGNVSVNGRQRETADWEAIPPSEGPVRHSLVRQYGTRAEDGNGPDIPAIGTMEDGWIVADLDGEGSTYFGQRGDIATPGFRTGGPLPVSLSSFNPKRNDAGAVVITWITSSELNNAGFNILRSQQRDKAFKVINPKMIAGAGTTSEKNVYTFTDTTAKPNVIYYYQIEDVSFNGQRQTLTTRRLRGHVSAGGKLTTTWSSLKQVR